MDKNKLIESMNEFKNTPIAPLKSKLTDNSDPDKFDALMTYNAMLDNITIGSHTRTTISYAGNDWDLRLLTSEEYINIRKDIVKQCKQEELFDEWYTNYLIIIKFLDKAQSSNPFKTDGKFNESQLKLIHYDILEEVYHRYLHWQDMALSKPTEMPEAEIEGIINIAKKKPEVLKEYGRPQLWTTAIWFMNYSQRLEKMLEPDTSN